MYGYTNPFGLLQPNTTPQQPALPSHHNWSASNGAGSRGVEEQRVINNPYTQHFMGLAPQVPVNPYRTMYQFPPCPPGAQPPIPGNQIWSQPTQAVSSLPPETYVCHQCKEKGHWVTHCPASGAVDTRCKSWGQQGRRGYPHGPQGRGGQHPRVQHNPKHHRQGQSSSSGAQGHNMGNSRRPVGSGQREVVSDDDDDNDDDTISVHGSEGDEDDGVMSVGVDGRPIAIFSCDPCEKDFVDEGQLRAHIASHIKCHHEGCQFRASRGAVVAHHRVVHGKYSGSGFRLLTVEGRRFRILVGNNPEEVEQWRADRRKNFPTRENVLKRVQQQQQRYSSGRPGGRGPGGMKRGREVGTPTVPPPKTVKTEAGACASQSAALGGLLTCYDDSGEEEGATQEGGGAISIAEQEAPVVADEMRSPQKRSVLLGVCRAFLRGQCRQGSHCRYRHGPRRMGPSYCRYFTKPGGTCGHGEGCRFVHDEQLKQELETWVAERKERNDAERQESCSHSSTVEGGHVETSGGSNAGGGSSQGSSSVAAPRPAPQPAQRKPRPQPAVNTKRRDPPTLLRRLLGMEMERETKLTLECIRFLVSEGFVRKVGEQPQN